LNTALTIEAPGVLKNDSAPENAKLSAELVAGTTHGEVVLNADGSFTYKPATGFAGADVFKYRAFVTPPTATPDSVTTTDTSNTQGGITTVTILVNGLPDAKDDFYSVGQNLVLTVPPRGVLTNDVPVTGHGLTAKLEGDLGPKHGTVELKEDGSFVYKP